VRLAERLRALDDRLVWTAGRPATPGITPMRLLALGVPAVCVYVGWALAWGWPRAALAVVVLGVLLTGAARFWFTAPDDPPAPPVAHGARLTP
jgi:hypothetical protein